MYLHDPLTNHLKALKSPLMDSSLQLHHCLHEKVITDNNPGATLDWIFCTNFNPAAIFPKQRGVWLTFWAPCIYLCVLEDFVKKIFFNPQISLVFHFTKHTPLSQCHLSALFSMEARFRVKPHCSFSCSALHDVLLHRSASPSTSQRGPLPLCCQWIDGRCMLTGGCCLWLSAAVLWLGNRKPIAEYFLLYK